MSSNSHDEADVLDRYLRTSVQFLMTDFERRSLNLAIMREKAEVSEPNASRLPKWLERETEDVKRASLAGPKAIRQAIEDRINRGYREGTLVVNRCPKCHRIVCTPLAKQCLWCGHDWHGT